MEKFPKSSLCRRPGGAAGRPEILRPVGFRQLIKNVSAPGRHSLPGDCLFRMSLLRHGPAGKRTALPPLPSLPAPEMHLVRAIFIFAATFVWSIKIQCCVRRSKLHHLPYAFFPQRFPFRIHPRGKSEHSHRWAGSHQTGYPYPPDTIGDRRPPHTAQAASAPVSPQSTSPPQSPWPPP